MYPHDPVGRLWLGASAIVLAFALNLHELVGLVTALTVSLLIDPAARRRLLWASRFLLPAVTFIVLVNGLIFPEARRAVVVLGIPFQVEGLLFAAAISARLAAITLAQLYMLGGDPFYLVVQALMARGMSPRLGFILLYTVTMTRQLRMRWRTVLDAQRSRGMVVGGGVVARVRALLPLLGPVAMIYLAESVERGLMLDLKGFGLSGPKSSVKPTPIRGRTARIGPWIFVASVVLLAVRSAPWIR